MSSERAAGSEGIKLSAEVKPFVPKYAAVTVAWSEPSEACVFPRYYGTCYPYVQEPPVDKQQIYTQDAPWDTTTSLSQYPSQNLMGCSSLGEYTSSPYSLNAAPNACTVTNFQGPNNSTKLYSSSKQDRDSAKQTHLIRKEAATICRRRPKDHESKWESKRPDGSEFSSRSTESSSYTALHGRNPIKSDRPIKAANGKFKQIPAAECLPEPAFEITLSDFPKLQGLGSSELLDIKKCAWGPLGSAEGDKLPPKPPEKTAISSLITKEGETTLKKHFPARPLSSSSDPGVPQVSPWPAVSWATVLSQAPKRVVSTPATVPAGGNSGSKGEDDIPENHKSETREYANDHEAEEMADKKKKKKKKKKKEKEKSYQEVETVKNKNILVQEPPRIEDVEEFPNLAAATDKKYRPTQKLCGAVPLTREQTEVITREPGFESHSGPPQNEPLAPNPDLPLPRKPGKQISSAPLEKRKMQPPKSSGKKSQVPVRLDLGGMLAALEQKQFAEKSKASKPVVLSVGGAVTVLSKDSVAVTKSQQLNQGKTPHNPLDSSAPLVKKGKQREVPKAKKPTSLKKIILKEREQRKQQHLLEQMAIPNESDAVLQGATSSPENQTFSEDTKAESTDEASTEPVIPTQGSSEVSLECTALSGSTNHSPVPTQPKSNLPKIHSRRFRDYCTQVLSKEVDSCVTDLLKELVRFQDRLYQKDPVKAKTKRRLVMGLREVLKHLKLKKLKCVIISPNCERIQSKGGLDETLHLIIDSACEQNIPFVFALNRKALGRCVNKAVPVSVVGIFSYDGAQDYFHKMVELTMEARLAYKEMIAALQKELAEEEKESDCTHLKTPCSEHNALDTGEAPLPESDEDVPNYIKIWKRKLEEEYNPYTLELEK